MCPAIMVASHLDFRKFTESARPPCLVELTQNQWIASSKLTGEDPGREIAFPYAGNLEIIQGADKSQLVGDMDRARCRTKTVFQVWAPQRRRGLKTSSNAYPKLMKERESKVTASPGKSTHHHAPKSSAP